MLEELESADVSTTMIIEKITDPIVNAGRAGRDEYLKQQRERTPYLPKEEYIKQQRKKRAQDRTHAPRKDCTCEACGYSTRELHKMLNDLHTGNPKECPLRGPKFNKDKQTRERLNQYNLKNKDDKKVDVSEERLYTPPQRPTIPKTNHVNVVQNLDDNMITRWTSKMMTIIQVTRMAMIHTNTKTRSITIIMAKKECYRNLM